MAVQPQTPYQEDIANGVTTVFPLQFDCENKDHLIVLIDDVEADSLTWSLANKQVTFTIPPESNKKITFQRNTPFKRERNYQSYDNSFRPDPVNKDFDRLWWKTQELGVADWLLGLKIQKFRDDVNLTALEETLEQSQELRDSTAVLAGEVENNVAQSQTLLADTTSKANQAEASATAASAANTAAQQALVQANAAEGNVYAALTTQTNTVNNALVGFTNGAAKFYPTLALAEADIANITIKDKVDIGEVANGGTWYKATVGATTLTKSPYDSVTQANARMDANPLFKQVVLTTENIKSITVPGIYALTSKTNVIPANGYPADTKANDAGFLRVSVAGSTFSYRLLEWFPRSTGTRFYCAYLFSTATWTEWKKSASSLDISALQTTLESEIAEVRGKINKPYEIITESPNLFDNTAIKVNQYISNSGVLTTSVAATGWATSDFIPVVAGQNYTISGSRSRQGVAFYSTKESAITAALSYDGTTTLPLTVQAPAGAQWMLINVYSATTPTYSNLQVEHGSTATEYQYFGLHYLINPSYIDASSNKKYKLEITGDTATVSGVVDGKTISEEILLTKNSTHSQSTVLNISKTTLDGVVQRTMTDDVAPLRADTTTIGANHGYAKNTVTCNAHGKTAADIGSVWTDGTYEWLVIEIVSANQIALTARASNRGSIASNNFTHVSGAANTASFTVTANVAGQWYQCFKNRKLTVTVDDISIDHTVDGVYEFSHNVAFHESYDIMKKSDIVEWLIANKGQDYQTYNADAAIKYSQSYVYDKEVTCVIYSSIVALKTIPFIDYMAIQAIPLNTGNGNIFYYVPKSTNYSLLVNSTTPPPSTVNFDSFNLEAGATPVDRLLMLNDSAVFASGYIPTLSALPATRSPKSLYGEIRASTGKWYPRVTIQGSGNLNEGDHYEVIAYRKMLPKPSGRTSNYTIRTKQGSYLYLDWHAAKTDEVKLPSDLVGREFEVTEKSSSVALLTTFANNEIVVKIDSTKNYGYLVSRFK